MDYIEFQSNGKFGLNINDSTGLQNMIPFIENAHLQDDGNWYLGRYVDPDGNKWDITIKADNA